VFLLPDNKVKRGFHPTATHATNLRSFRISEITQAPDNRNRTVIYPIQLNSSFKV